ncbi:hypothetical protein [Polaribacter sp. Asnod1-A03]|uniref:hypothetical protein n=1 Tax=Polaribacter sp. Asnod1-A03 TaxID=3160581 RepID=UPI00386F45DA
MKKIWHFIFYGFYKLDYAIHLFTNKINPIVHLYKTERASNYFKKKGRSPIKDLNDVYENRTYGFSVLISQFIMHILLFAILIGIFNFTLIIFNLYVEVEPYMFMSILGFSIFLNLFLLLREKDYLRSFVKFDDYKKNNKRIFYLLSFLSVIVLFYISYLSFKYGSKHHSLK